MFVGISGYQRLECQANVVGWIILESLKHGPGNGDGFGTLFH